MATTYSKWDNTFATYGNYLSNYNLLIPDGAGINMIFDESITEAKYSIIFLPYNEEYVLRLENKLKANKYKFVISGENFILYER